MRKKEKEVKDPEAIRAVLDGAMWGTLGLVAPDGHCLMVPISFVQHQDRIYFHSAPAGEKLQAIKAHPEVSFLVVDPLAKIPSFVLDPADANAGFLFFRSVILHGRIGFVTDLARKAEILAALMKKYQPEGHYEPVTVANPTYKSVVKGVAVLEMTVERTSAKFSLGQKLKPEEKAAIMQFLGERGRDNDQRTLEAMASWAGPSGDDAKH
jgi:nitroimidazol reductase NimA-like FMN-containing flavoprotein (pyridoxamine 5'-phosphate oxidase superfamily)